jgi:hypothetical protein
MDKKNSKEDDKRYFTETEKLSVDLEKKIEKFKKQRETMKEFWGNSKEEFEGYNKKQIYEVYHDMYEKDSAPECLFYEFIKKEKKNEKKENGKKNETLLSEENLSIKKHIDNQEKEKRIKKFQCEKQYQNSHCQKNFLP